MIFCILIFLIIIIFIFCMRNKITIKWKTFFEKGFKPNRGVFGVYTYDGKQGSGKTFSLVEYLLDNKEDIIIYCNISDVKGIEYTLIHGFKDLIAIKYALDNGTLKIPKNKFLVIVYDELFTELNRYSKLNDEIMDFLCQMRKRGIVLLTTVQEWSELPLTWRRFCRYRIHCRMIPILNTGILIKRICDAENMKWSNDEQEHVAPLLETTVTKCRLRIANSYDTKLRIHSEPILNK